MSKERTDYETSHSASVPRGTGDLLLDSSLIVTTNKQTYNTKIINCNDYIQVYFMPDTKARKDKDIEPIKNNISKINTDNLRKTDLKTIPKIETKNIIRSKLSCQRLAKANIKNWCTFITLTIAENLKDIKIANKKLRNFIDQVKRIYKDFMYICVPEYQDRGAVHYHLLTNIDVKDTRFIFLQEDNPIFKHVKYWKEGFTKVDSVKNKPQKIIGYISKYMTGGIDNRLFNCHRYFYSRNLNKPTVSYLDLNDLQHLEYFNSLVNEKKVIYENNYLNSYNNETIIFQEYF